MDFLTKAPEWIVNMAPEGAVRDFVSGWGWFVILAVVGLIALLLLWGVARALFGRKGPPAKGPKGALEEDLSAYPPAPARTGDRRLLVEGTPVRLRLVVVAPAGAQSEERLDVENLDRLLERVLPGLGDIFKEDKPRVKLWPRQQSYKGFATHFHRNMLTPEEEGELSPWVLVAGRVKVKEFQFMLGLALVAMKPTTIGQRTIDAHEWPTVLRVRVRD